jgi:hypothetical protein
VQEQMERLTDIHIRPFVDYVENMFDWVNTNHTVTLAVVIEKGICKVGNDKFALTHGMTKSPSGRILPRHEKNQLQHHSGEWHLPYGKDSRI